MEYPNKIFVLEYKGENSFNMKSHFVIVVAASDYEVAKKHVREMIGFEAEPTWLMNGVYPTIYNISGSNPTPIQAKILYNGNMHISTKQM